MTLGPLDTWTPLPLNSRTRGPLDALVFFVGKGCAYKSGRVIGRFQDKQIMRRRRAVVLSLYWTVCRTRYSTARHVRRIVGAIVAQQLCFFIIFALTPLCVRSGADYNRAHRLCTSGVDARINESGSEYEEPKKGAKSAIAHGPWCTAASLGLTHPAHSGSGSVGSANPNNAWVRRPHRPTSRSVWRAVQRPVRGGSRASRNRPTSRRAG